MCKAEKKEVHAVKEEMSQADSANIAASPLFVGAVNMPKAASKDWLVNLKIYDKTVSFTIDTGAQCNVITRSNQEEVRYVGDVFNQSGIKPSPDRVQAITELPLPNDKKSLQRFMGMVNYLHKFIPNLATVNKPLRQLLEESVE
jgi:hypothetical protein